MSQHLIQEYYSRVEKTRHYGGSGKETAIRNHFFNLLNEYAHQKGLERSGTPYAADIIY